LPLVVYVDVDDTLVRSFGSKRIPITGTIALVRELHANGATLFCWSTAGAEYARQAATELGLAELFTAFLPKPHLLLDDVPVGDWKLKELHPNECISLSAADLLARNGF
jgi:hypothetical protein